MRTVVFVVVIAIFGTACADTNFNISELVKTLQCEPNHLNLTTLANGKKYFFSAFQVNWFEARKFCEDNKMHLATPKTAEELSLLQQENKKQVQKLMYWWVGAMSAAVAGETTSGEFWWGDGEVLATESALWVRGEPSDHEKGRDVCVYVGNEASEKLRDYKCADLNRFVCQLPQHCY